MGTAIGGFKSQYAYGAAAAALFSIMWLGTLVAIIVGVFGYFEWKGVSKAWRINHWQIWLVCESAALALAIPAAVLAFKKTP